MRQNSCAEAQFDSPIKPTEAQESNLSSNCINDWQESSCLSDNRGNSEALVHCGVLPDCVIDFGDDNCASTPSQNQHADTTTYCPPLESCTPDGECTPIEQAEYDCTILPPQPTDETTYCPPMESCTPDGECTPIEQTEYDCTILPPQPTETDDQCPPIDSCIPDGDCTISPPPNPPETTPIAPPVDTPTIRPEEPPVSDTGGDTVGDTIDFQPRPGLEGGRARVEIGRGSRPETLPEGLREYARYEGGMLVIDAKGNEIPPLSITSDNVVIRNARIKGDQGPAVSINGADNVTIEDSEITGGSRGILADRSSNITVKNNWLHDFDWREKFDTTAVEFDHVNGGRIEGNRINGLFKSDSVSMYESQNLVCTGNNIDITIDEWSSAPLMVEGNSAYNIEVSNNVINYPVGNNVPPGLLGGRNHRANNNIVNGDRSVGAWQMYAYNDVWQDIYFNGVKLA